MNHSASPPDIDRLYNLRERIAELESGRVRTTDAKDRDTSAKTLAMFRRSADTIEAAWSNDRLLAAYRLADEAERDALLAEIEHRGLVL